MNNDRLLSPPLSPEEEARFREAWVKWERDPRRLDHRPIMLDEGVPSRQHAKTYDLPSLRLYRIRHSWLRRPAVILACIPMTVFWMVCAVVRAALFGTVTLMFALLHGILDALHIAFLVSPLAFGRTWRGERPPAETR